MQKLRDKICKLVKTTCRRGDEDSQGNCTTKTKKDEQCSQNLFSPVRYFFRKISPHFITPWNEFLFQRPKKNVSNYDNVWYRRRHCLSERFLESEWRMKNETGQLSRQITLYWPQKFKQYPTLQPTQPKREMFEALMPVARSISHISPLLFLSKEGTNVNIHNAHNGFKIPSIVYYI